APPRRVSPGDATLQAHLRTVARREVYNRRSFPIMMKMMWALEDSAFAQWVAGAPTIWAYPSILTFHTVGMGIVVGACIVMDLRLLGVGPEVPVERLKGLFKPLWYGFWLNAVTGVVLFIAHAAEKATQEVF